LSAYFQENNINQAQMKQFSFMFCMLFTLSSVAQNEEEVIRKIYNDTNHLRDFFDRSKVDTFYLNRMMEMEDLINEKGFEILPIDIICAKLIEVNVDYDTRPGTAEMSKVMTRLFDEEGKVNSLVDTAKGFDLTLGEIDQIRNIVEQPLNFTWAECGTYIPQAVILFFDQNRKISFALTVGCGSIRTYPSDLRIKFGGLVPDANEQLFALLSRIRE